MSIYSGFATRFQEESYDHCLDSLLYLLQKRIIKFYQNDTADEERFITLVLKLHQQMRNMEKNKYLQPKSSMAIAELIRFMQVFQENTGMRREQLQRSPQEQPRQETKPVVLPEVPIKKKSTLWVEKVPSPDEQSNPTSSEQEMQAINKNNYDVTINQGGYEMRKTSYNPASLRGVRLKHPSRSNIGKIHKEERRLAEVRPPKNRSMSNYIQPQSTTNSKLTHYAHSFRSDAEPQTRQKSRPAKKGDFQTLQTPDSQNEVADIIKEYILKAKKNHLRGSRNLDLRDPVSRVHDF